VRYFICFTCSTIFLCPPIVFDLQTDEGSELEIEKLAGEQGKEQAEIHLEILEVRHDIMASLPVVDDIATILGVSTHRTSSCASIETSADLLGGEAHARLKLGGGFNHLERRYTGDF